MKRYAAFLRGINISGKNRIAMAQLKSSLEELGFSEVRTYLNSGNAVFFSMEEDTALLAEKICLMIKTVFGLDILVFVLPLEELKDILNHAPLWWGTDDRDIYDNLIFIIPPADYEEIRRELGEPAQGLEKAEPYGNAIFWSFVRKDYQKTNWWPASAKMPAAGKITVRTANTVKKIADF